MPSIYECKSCNLCFELGAYHDFYDLDYFELLVCNGCGLNYKLKHIRHHYYHPVFVSLTWINSQQEKYGIPSILSETDFSHDMTIEDALTILKELVNSEKDTEKLLDIFETSKKWIKENFVTLTVGEVSKICSSLSHTEYVLYARKFVSEKKYVPVAKRKRKKKYRNHSDYIVKPQKNDFQEVYTFKKKPKHGFSIFAEEFQDITCANCNTKNTIVRDYDYRESQDDETEQFSCPRCKKFTVEWTGIWDS
jgi:hypothetical protein